MKIYILFIIKKFLISFLYIALIMMSLLFIINLLSEIDFFNRYEVEKFFPIYMSMLNTPSLFFEIMPFVILISTQLFFITFLNNNELQIFKYSGLKNSKIILIICSTALLLGLFFATFYYNFSANFKKFYLELKSNYSDDGKYLAVVTKNGLWIKDKINNKSLIINANRFEKNFLINSFITEFDENFEAIRNIKSEKINMSDKNWIIFNPDIFENNTKYSLDKISLQTNFDYKTIQSLFSNLSSLSFFQLIELKKNYITLNYSTTEVNVQIQKIISYPFYLTMMTLISAIIMFNIKYMKSFSLKISLGFLASVFIYYINNFFNVLGTTEKISHTTSIWLPIILLFIVNSTMLININEK